MEEILGDLLTDTTEKKISRQCYFNLRSTFRSTWKEPSQFQIRKQFHNGTKYLRKSYESHSPHGFQSVTSKNLQFQTEGNPSPEILTSVMALDILHYNNSNKVSSSKSEESPEESSLDPELLLGLDLDVVNEIIEFVTPANGLTNFGLYKRDLDDDEEKNEEDGNFNAIAILAICVLLESGELSPQTAKIFAKFLKDDFLSRFESQLVNEEDQNDVVKNSKNDPIDPIECCHLLRLLFQLDLAEGTEDVQDFLYSYLELKLYLPDSELKYLECHEKTPLLFSADAFLYFLTRTIILCPKAEELFKDLLWDQLLDRLGHDCVWTSFNRSSPSQIDPHFSPVNIGLRILTWNLLSPLISIPRIQKQSVQQSLLMGELRGLMECQGEDGGFPSDSLCLVNNLYFGGEQISSLIAVRALQSAIIDSS